MTSCHSEKRKYGCNNIGTTTYFRNARTSKKNTERLHKLFSGLSGIDGTSIRNIGTEIINLTKPFGILEKLRKCFKININEAFEKYESKGRHLQPDLAGFDCYM